MNCANCGTQLSENAKFCRVCGTPVASAAAPTQPLPVPPPAEQYAPAAAPYPPQPPPPPGTPYPPQPAPPPGTPYPPQPAPAPQPAPPPQPWAPTSQQPQVGPPPATAPQAPPGGSRTALVVSLSILGVLFLCAIAGAGVFAATRFGLIGGKPRTAAVTSATSATSADATSSQTSDPGATTPAEPAPAGPPVAPAGTVLDLKDQPKDAARAALRLQLLDAARARFSTTSKFFVNQIWVDGDIAIGEIGAEHGGHRIWVVWRGTPWKVVWYGNWGSTDEAVLKQKIGTLPPELLARINWTKTWPKEFKFIP